MSTSSCRKIRGKGENLSPASSSTGSPDPVPLLHQQLLPPGDIEVEAGQNASSSGGGTGAELLDVALIIKISC